MYKNSFSIIKKCYDLLQDEVSKKIFEYRFMWLLTHDDEYMKRLVNHYASDMVRRIGYIDENKNKKSLAEEYIQQLDSFIIYGIGVWGKQLLEKIPQNKHIILCDKKAAEGMKTYKGLDIITPEKLSERYKEYKIIVSTLDYYDEIVESLCNQGIKKENIISIGEQLHIPWCDNYHQYFDKDLIKLQENEVFLDCGLYHGETTFKFLKWCDRNYKKIIAFEPNRDSYLFCLNQTEIQNIKNFQIFNKGVWNKNETLHFKIANGTDSFITNEDGEELIETITIDEVLAGEGATFIKMDVEGAELNALYGAKMTIQNYRPKLAICIYHKPEDIITILSYLYELVPEYKFYLRHYSTYSQETVLYAIP